MKLVRIQKFPYQSGMISPSVALSLWLAVWGLAPSYPTSPTPSGTPKQEQQEPAAYQSEPYPASHSATGADKDCCCGSQQNEKEDDWITRSAVATAVFTLALVAATIALWRAGKKHSELELRAYVNVSDATINRLVVRDYIQAVISIKNGGQTPAYKITTRSGIWLDTCPSYRPLETGEWKKSTIALGTGADDWITATSVNILSEGDYVRLRDEQLAIYVVVMIQYTDIFKRLQTTSYRGFFTNLNRRWGSLGGDLPLRPSEDGNEAT